MQLQRRRFASPDRPKGRRAALEGWAEAALNTGLQFAGATAALIVAVYVGAKLVLIGSPSMPELQGRFKFVGSRICQIGGVRCRLFYPSRDGVKAEAPYLSEGTRTGDAMAGLVFFPGFLFEHLAVAGSGCIEDGPPLTEPGLQPGFPLLVYSHGQGGNMDMATYFMRQLASFGLVVAALEHQDGSATTGDAGNSRPFKWGTEQLGVGYRASEILRVTEALTSAGGLASELGADCRFVLVGGHSYGGPSAISAAAQRPDLFQGLVLHDPALSSAPPLPLPVHSICGDEYARMARLTQAVRQLGQGSAYVRSSRWTGAWRYAGISHGNFVDAPLWGPLPFMELLSRISIPAAGPADPAEAHRLMAEAAADFAYGLRGSPLTLGQGPRTPVMPL